MAVEAIVADGLRRRGSNCVEQSRWQVGTKMKAIVNENWWRNIIIIIIDSCVRCTIFLYCNCNSRVTSAEKIYN